MAKPNFDLNANFALVIQAESSNGKTYLLHVKLFHYQKDAEYVKVQYLAKGYLAEVIPTEYVLTKAE